MLKWENQIVVITGGSGGIGRIIVETLAVMRVTVVVLDIVEFDAELGTFTFRLSLLHTAANTLDDTDDVHYYKCDLSNHLEIESVAAKVQSEVRNFILRQSRA